MEETTLFQDIVTQCARTRGINAVQLPPKGTQERELCNSLMKNKRCKKWTAVRLPPHFGTLGKLQMIAIANKMLDMSRDGDIYWEITQINKTFSNKLEFWS